VSTVWIERLASLRGVGTAYHDYRGELREFSLETQRGILAAMGTPVDDEAAVAEEVRRLEIAKWCGLLPPVAAARGPRIGFDCNIPGSELGSALVWSVHLEDGGTQSGSVSTVACPELWHGEVQGRSISRRRFELPLDLPPGYHELEARVGEGPVQRTLLVMSPPLCYEPPAIRGGARLWGVALQLYTVRSRDNWGIGDFQDLQHLVRWLAPAGAGFIGLNPLHALSPAEPGRASPYSASNRHFLNVLYIAVPAVDEFIGSAAAQAHCAQPAFAARLAALRAAPLVDYVGVAALKFEVLQLVFREFRAAGGDAAGGVAAGGVAADGVAPSARHAALAAFVAAGGESLRRQALFDAIDRHCRSTLGTPAGWMSWPENLRDPAGEGARRFALEHAEDVEFFLYLQWLAHEQLSRAQALAAELGMPVGLYGDYAVGASASGAESWSDRASYRLQAEIGAPPDALALKGQGWGIPPPDPLALEQDRLQGFVRLIRDNMRYYGALRLDHVMSLFRLWWVPAHHSPLDGAYVHYPMHQLLTVLALESDRARCLVVGEDLGVVPDEMRAAMPQYGVYHYKVMLFEQSDGRFRAPGEYLRRALATVTTHDMPTLRGYWEGDDIDLRVRLNLYPSADSVVQVRAERDADRRALLAALRAEGLAPSNPSEPAGPFTPALAQALHLYLARSTAALGAVQIEDLLGIADPVNVPGTSHEYPNWQRKLNADLEDIVARPELLADLAEIGRARAGRTR
jgi:4-alpha-glucanotransferase